MASVLNRLLCLLLSAGPLGGWASAAPLNSKLLALVPPGAEVVAGFDNHRAGKGEWRLLYISRNNRLDLDDWQALAGVDGERTIDEVVAVNAAPSGKELTEHLVLLAGRFDKERIFGAAERNGARTAICRGETVLIVKPFPRERGTMLDTRWLAVLDNRVGMLGTELMVEAALHQYATHAAPDARLLEHLAQIPPGASSWNVLGVRSDSARELILTKSGGGLARSLAEIALFTVCTRCSRKFRLDFSLHAREIHDRTFFTQKAEAFAEMFAAMAGLEPDVSRRSWLAGPKFEPDHVHGSIELSAREFRSWREQSHDAHSSQ